MGLDKLFVSSTSSAMVAGALLHIALPAILGALVATVISGLSILDPLYAATRIKATWSALGAVLMLHVLHTVLSVPLASELVGTVASRLQSTWLFVAAVLLSMVVHYFVLLVLVAGSSLLPAMRIPGLVWGLSVAICSFVGPVIGVVCVLAIQRSGA